jgi:hypothetical protein
MADIATAEIPKADEAVRQIKTRTRRAVTHLRAVTAEPIAEAKDATEDGIISLREQIGDLAKQVEQFAEDRFEDAQEVVANVADGGVILAARAGRQTLATARAIRDDPLPLIVGLGVVALTAAFIVGNSNRR